MEQPVPGDLFSYFIIIMQNSHKSKMFLVLYRFFCPKEAKIDPLSVILRHKILRGGINFGRESMQGDLITCSEGGN